MSDTNIFAAPLPRHIRRALQAMSADIERDWRIADLAEIACSSTRTLQRQFGTFLGKSFGAALREMRFEAARRKLLQGRPDIKIMDVALSCGFSHFGRFSVEYHRRYRETPSQTVSRRAVLAMAISTTSPMLQPRRYRPAVSFQAIESTPANTELARHIAEELAHALMCAGISTTSQSTSAPHRIIGRICDVHDVKVLHLRLLDAPSGHTLWAYRSDVDCSIDPLLATKAVTALRPCLNLLEIDRAEQKPAIDLNSYELALRAIPCITSLDANGNRQALDLLGRAIDLDPDHALATALAAWAHAQRVVYHFTETPHDDRIRGIALARRALTLPADATVLAVVGNALTVLHELDEADAATRRALAIDGGSAWAWSRSGWIDLYKGKPQSAIERLKLALDLAPQDSFAFNSMVGIGCAHFEAGRYDDAAYWQERALLEHPSATWVHRTLCPAYMLGDKPHHAQRSLAALRQGYPELTLSGVKRGLPPLTRAYRDRVISGLSDAGLPA